MITICPAGPHDPALNYDQSAWQRRPKAVSINSQLTFNDFETMHVEIRNDRSGRKDCIPVFSHNNEQLRLVLAKMVWQRCHSNLKFPDGLQHDLDRLRQIAN
jgi:hypothetical protein